MQQHSLAVYNRGDVLKICEKQVHSLATSVL